MSEQKYLDVSPCVCSFYKRICWVFSTSWESSACSISLYTSTRQNVHCSLVQLCKGAMMRELWRPRWALQGRRSAGTKLEDCVIGVYTALSVVWYTWEWGARGGGAQRAAAIILLTATALVHQPLGLSHTTPDCVKFHSCEIRSHARHLWQIYHSTAVAWNSWCHLPTNTTVATRINRMSRKGTNEWYRR